MRFASHIRSVCVCVLTAATQPTGPGRSAGLHLNDPLPLCGHDESLQCKQRAQAQRLLPRAHGYGADNHKPPEHASQPERVTVAKLSLLPLCAFNTVLGALLALAGALAREHALACAGLTSSFAAPGGCRAAWRERQGNTRPSAQPTEASVSPSDELCLPAQKLQADLKGKRGDLVPPLALCQAKPSASTPAPVSLAAEDVIECELFWAFGRTLGRCVRVKWLRRSPQVMCGKPVRNWAAPTHCVGFTKARKVGSELTCSACCLQPVDKGLINTDHQRMRLNLSGTLL